MQHTIITPISYTHLARLEYKGHIDGGGAEDLVVMTGAVSFVVKIFTEASASVASMVVTALTSCIKLMVQRF